MTGHLHSPSQNLLSLMVSLMNNIRLARTPLFHRGQLMVNYETGVRTCSMILRSGLCCVKPLSVDQGDTGSQSF